MWSSLLASGWSQQISKSDRDLAQHMLRDVASDVEKSYYDPQLHGVDWSALVRQTKDNIDKTDSMDGAVSEIAALLDSLHDSHTRFFPPPRAYSHDYGFSMRMIGNACYVTRVKPGSDAEKKGLRRGEIVSAVNEIRVSRQTLSKIEYIFDVLRPQPGLRLTLSDDGAPSRQFDVMAKIEPSKVIKYFLKQGANQIARDWGDEVELLEPRFFEKGDLLVVRLPAFALPADEVDHLIGKMRNHKGVVLDLRGNPGGFVGTVDRLLGGMFQHQVKIADRMMRKEAKQLSVPGRHDAFVGRFAVLIDSKSASASEIFARVVQLERRGFVIGDRSAGMVMESKGFPHELFVDGQVYFGANITDANLIMADGKSLESVGVEPDILILPTAKDLDTRRDPALAKAAGLVGANLTTEEAGAAFKEENK
jgi:carboxyl-terminal processing protease